MIAEAIGLKHTEGWANDLLAESLRPAARNRAYWEAAAASQVELWETVRRVWAHIVRSLGEKGLPSDAAVSLAELTLKIADEVASFHAVALEQVSEPTAEDRRETERAIAAVRRQVELIVQTARLAPVPDEARLQEAEAAMRRGEGEDSLALLAAGQR